MHAQKARKNGSASRLNWRKNSIGCDASLLLRGEIRFDFESSTAEIVKLADWDTVKSNVFAKTAIRYIQSLPEAKLPSEAVVRFDQAL